MSKFLLILLICATVFCLAVRSATYTGRMSTFGGPNDRGVTPSEGLALYSSVSQRPSLFLSYQPAGTTGLARRLDPSQYYIAMRWNYAVTSAKYLRSHQVVVKNPANGLWAYAWPADYGPSASTGRIADLSPGLASDLGLDTDDMVTVTV